MFRSWYATCPRGAEEALEAELQGLGAKGVRPGHGGVRFTGEREIALRGCLDLRTALRVLEPVGEFKATTADELYEGAAKIPWQELVARGQTLAVAASGRAEGLTHTHFVEQKLKDAVVAVVLYSGWEGTTPLRDPLCGSGTLAIEAALFASKRAPNLRRALASERWPRTAAEDGRILARLRSELAAPGQLLLNVPYGERLEAGGRKPLKTFYHQLGESFRKLKGHRAAVLSGNEDFESAFGVRPRGPRRTLWNGPLRCTLYRYEL